MNKLILLSIIGVLAVPSMLSAKQGADDTFEHGMPVMMNQSGTTWEMHHLPPMMGSGVKRPPMMGSGGTKPPMWSGAILPLELKGLGLAIGQLKPEDRAALVALIKDFFTSKGIDLSKFADERSEIRDVRKSTQNEIKDMRKQNLEAMKLKREEMRGKILEMRGGKVNVQDISMTK